MMLQKEQLLSTRLRWLTLVPDEKWTNEYAIFHTFSQDGHKIRRCWTRPFSGTLFPSFASTFLEVEKVIHRYMRMRHSTSELTVPSDRR